ncbi:metalloprotease [Hyalangium rubrum]|uniref:Site-2 protease family protein n=1 Tax=Hyalangium rubrum TaxID=3103134 RepID=A0ABU5H8Q6_9BACT|nr:site-2 protease family protein [Hyalangium sp. s54d21]MDY7229621.1 site-2 protease family protein [Hyalangium sp. s54d21]
MTPRFRLAGFPVQVHPLFLLTTLGLGASLLREPARLAVWFGVVFASVLVHELGHALTYRRYGCPASITLHGLGGTTTGEDAERLTHRQRLWVSLAGPVAGFVLGCLVWGVRELTPAGLSSGLAGFTFQALIWTNFGLGLLNLLPIVPLDGGHIMAAVIRERGGSRYEWLIHLISLGVAACGLVLAILYKELWLGLLALSLGVMNGVQYWRARVEGRYMRQLRSPTLLRRTRPAAGEAEAHVEQLLQDLRLNAHASNASKKRPSPARPPAELPEVPHDPRFVGELLLDSGLAEFAIRPLQAAFTAEPSARTGHALTTALLNAGRFADLEQLLSGPGAPHLGGETLALIATRADTEGQSALAIRARELHRSRGEPLSSQGAHESKKPR